MSEEQKEHVVVQNGQRITPTMTEADAQKEAARLRKLQEGQQLPEEKQPKVVQNLMG